MLRMIIEGRMTVTLIRKITSPTIRTSIPHWSNGVAAQHSFDLKVRKSHTLEFFTKFAEVLWLAGGGQNTYAEVSAFTFAFSVPFVLTCQSRNHRSSFHP
jgi:hypothetical protein